MEKDDEVLHGDGEVEEAIPLVIFNEEKKRKYFIIVIINIVLLL